VPERGWEVVDGVVEIAGIRKGDVGERIREVVDGVVEGIRKGDVGDRSREVVNRVIEHRI
jgi:hypothetical protein